MLSKVDACKFKKDKVCLPVAPSTCEECVKGDMRFSSENLKKEKKDV
jgi:hypothetical protein